MDEENNKNDILKSDILKQTLKKIDYNLSSNNLTDIDLYLVYKFYFSNYYDLSYEFSAKELILELDKIYIENNIRAYYDDIINKIALIEYKDNSLSEEEIKLVYKNLKLVIEHIIKQNNTASKGFFKKLFGKN